MKIVFSGDHNLQKNKYIRHDIWANPRYVYKINIDRYRKQKLKINRSDKSEKNINGE